MGREERRCLFSEEHCFWTSFTPGHSVRAAAQLLYCYHARWSRSRHPTAFAAIILVLSLYASQQAHLWMYRWVDLSGIFVWVIVVWLVKLSGETKESYHSAMRLMSHCYFFSTTAALFLGFLFWFVFWLYDYVLFKEKLTGAIFPPVIKRLKISICVFMLEHHLGLPWSFGV